MQAVPLLMSMSIATPDDESTSDKKESTLGFPFFVKNTFIDIVDDFSVPTLTRRSASAPPTPRGTDSNGSTCFFGPLSPLKSPSARSDASTSSEVCTEMDLSDDSCAESVTSESVGVTLTLSELVPAPPVPTRTKLNTGAKVWTPNHRVGSTLPMPTDVKSQFGEVLSAAQAALMRCACINQVASTKRDTDWTLEASCQQAYMANSQVSLAMAQQAILCAAQKSKSVRILGCKKTPFKLNPSGLGFTVQLALVEDEAAACWDLLTTGTCCRNGHCRWQHPTWKISLNVHMKALNV